MSAIKATTHAVDLVVAVFRVIKYLVQNLIILIIMKYQLNMRNSSGIVLSSIILALATVGCHQSKDISSTVLKATLDDAKVVMMNPDDIIWLETNDSSTIYDISNLNLLDGRMLIQSRSLWKIFTADGQFVGEVAHKGEAPEDFTWIGNIWNDDSLAYLYDFQINKIQKYDSDGNYHGYDTINRGPADNINIKPDEVYFTKEDGVFYVNTFMGVPPFNYVFSHASDINTEPKAIEPRKHQNGHTFWNRVFVDDNNHRLLYWEHIKDTLFSVNTDGVYPLYVFDYGKNTVPKEITDKGEVVDRYMDLQNIGDNDYAYPMRYFQMHDDKIYFLVPKSKQGYIGCIDEDKKKVAFTEFRTPQGMHLLPQLFFKIEGDSILLSVIDEDKPESNPGLLKFPISGLQKP